MTARRAFLAGMLAGGVAAVCGMTLAAAQQAGLVATWWFL